MAGIEFLEKLYQDRRQPLRGLVGVTLFSKKKYKTCLRSSHCCPPRNGGQTNQRCCAGARLEGPTAVLEMRRQLNLDNEQTVDPQWPLRRHDLLNFD